MWRITAAENDSVRIIDMDFLSNGDMIVSGQIHHYWSPFIPKPAHAVDGILMRINTCGEIEWLNIETRHPHEELKLWDPLRMIHIDEQDNIWVNHYVGYPTFEDYEHYVDGNRGHLS